MKRATGDGPRDISTGIRWARRRVEEGGAAEPLWRDLAEALELAQSIEERMTSAGAKLTDDELDALEADLATFAKGLRSVALSFAKACVQARISQAELKVSCGVVAYASARILWRLSERPETAMSGILAFAFGAPPIANAAGAPR